MIQIRSLNYAFQITGPVTDRVHVPIALFRAAYDAFECFVLAALVRLEQAAREASQYDVFDH